MNPKQIRQKWNTYAPRYSWGDPLDVRFYLCERLEQIHNKKILDVGCNAGIITSCLSKDNDVIGVDLESKALSIAKRINPHATFIKEDFFNLGNLFKKETFDVIILSHVLPKDNYASMYFPEELLDVVIPLLKKGGILYITTPSVERCYNRKGKFINRPYLVHLLERYPLKSNVYHWCPWNINFNHLLCFIPGIFSILTYLSKKNLRSVTFYVEAIKK